MRRWMDLVLGMAKEFGIIMMVVGIVVAVVFMIKTHYINNEIREMSVPKLKFMTRDNQGGVSIYRLEVYHPEPRVYYIVHTTAGVAISDK